MGQVSGQCRAFRARCRPLQTPIAVQFAVVAICQRRRRRHIGKAGEGRPQVLPTGTLHSGCDGERASGDVPIGSDLGRSRRGAGKGRGIDGEACAIHQEACRFDAIRTGCPEAQDAVVEFDHTVGRGGGGKVERAGESALDVEAGWNRRAQAGGNIEQRGGGEAVEQESRLPGDAGEQTFDRQMEADGQTGAIFRQDRADFDGLLVEVENAGVGNRPVTASNTEQRGLLQIAEPQRAPHLQIIRRAGKVGPRREPPLHAGIAPGEQNGDFGNDAPFQFEVQVQNAFVAAGGPPAPGP